MLVQEGKLGGRIDNILKKNKVGGVHTRERKVKNRPKIAVAETADIYSPPAIQKFGKSLANLFPLK